MSDLTEKLAKIGAEMNDEDIRAIRRECDTLRGRNVVHKDELRELIDKWRDEAGSPNNLTYNERWQIRNKADDLEELLDE